MPRQVFEGVVVLDITQSMDTEDMKRIGASMGNASTQTMSRLEYAKAILMFALPNLPCGSKMGLGVFTEYRTLMLSTPVEVCANVAELQEMVGNIDGKNAWSGNSEIAKGLYWALKLAAQLPNKPSLVFFTDGQEAPPINAENRLSFPGKVGEVHGVLAGVGGSLARPIPKRDPEGRRIGFWDASEVNQTHPFGGGINATADAPPESTSLNDGKPKNRDGASTSTVRTAGALLGATPGTEHLSALRDRYLTLLAGEVGLAYVTMRNLQEEVSLFSRPELTHWRWLNIDAAWFFASLSLIALLVYICLALISARSPGKFLVRVKHSILRFH
jgi:mxaL protein